MITIDNAYEICMAILPAATSVLSIVGVALGILSKFKKLRDEIKDKTDLNEYKEQIQKITEDDKAIINQLIDENRALQLQITELVNKIDGIKRSK